MQESEKSKGMLMNQKKQKERVRFYKHRKSAASSEYQLPVQKTCNSAEPL